MRKKNKLVFLEDPKLLAVSPFFKPSICVSLEVNFGKWYPLTLLVFKVTLISHFMGMKRYIKSWKEIPHVFTGGKKYCTLPLTVDCLNRCPFHSNFTDYKTLQGKSACEM